MEDLGISAPTAPVDTGAPAVSTYVEPTASSGDIMNEMSDLLDGDAPAPVETNIPTDKGNDVKPPAATTKPVAQPTPATPPPAAAAEPAKPPAADAPPAEPAALPEGVRERTIDGKKAWLVDPAVGQATMARVALVDQAEQILGEPMTQEALKIRQDFFEGFEKMRADMISDDPADQAKVIDHLTGVIEQAAANGEIGHDALSSFVTTAIDKALATDGPLADKVLAHISERLLGDQNISTALLGKVSEHQQVLQSVIDGVYTAALTEADPAIATALWNSAQQIETKKFGPGVFRPIAEMAYLRTTGAISLPTYQRADAPPKAVPAPPATAPTPVPTRTTESEQAYKGWETATNTRIHQEAIVKNINAALDQVIDASLKEKYPNYYKSARGQLVAAVDSGLKSDTQLQGQIDHAIKRARLAVNPEIRNQIQTELIRQYAQRAARILNENKGPILSEYSALLKAKSAEDNQRAAASQRAGHQASPSGGPSASRQAVPPPNTGKFNSPSDFNKELESALA